MPKTALTIHDRDFNTTTWLQAPWHVRPDDRQWKAVVHLADGQIVEKTATG